MPKPGCTRQRWRVWRRREEKRGLSLVVGMDTESIASIRRANGALFFGATGVDQLGPSFLCCRPFNQGPTGPTDGDDSLRRTEGSSETEDLLDPEDVTLTKVNLDSLPTVSSQETGSQDVIGSPSSLRQTEGQEDQATSCSSSEPLRLLQADIQHGKAP
ncbi:hypothetical protein JTB14_013560 [Gonioctena quinquepunctata]|nr:hypothetical protein JTB14_013560 [Gonioctena quinquepunctata]